MYSPVRRRRLYQIQSINSEFITHTKRFSKFSRLNFWAPRRTKFSKGSQMTSDKRDLLKDEHTWTPNQKPSQTPNTCKKTIAQECCFKKCTQVGFNTPLTTSSKWKCSRDSSNTGSSGNSTNCLKHGGSWHQHSGTGTLMSTRRLVIFQVRSMLSLKTRCPIKGRLHLFRAQGSLLWEMKTTNSISCKALRFFNTPMMIRMVDHQSRLSLECMLNHQHKIRKINLSFLGVFMQTVKVIWIPWQAIIKAKRKILLNLN